MDGDAQALADRYRTRILGEAGTVNGGRYLRFEQSSLSLRVSD